ncbi:hypothetical protein E5676_scaffold205G002110 [Cucumis melo var. makuwa]|uniref:Uncharacterized protein n=1 Tax=Cucumis melo var. makuwa TaxID=1194695 RepID=A0A5D3DLB1_CUCMM|nr:hypothetical protein E6C27_scaffold43052G002410 [Cucumis melo var. makuwa]TYK24417.1 hypothetical protein E5676_scaffold205G002110 [Cucumis melo var. makuwa]
MEPRRSVVPPSVFVSVPAPAVTCESKSAKPASPSRSPSHVVTYRASPTPAKHDSSDSTGSSQPNCLSVSSGYATDQFVLDVSLGHRRPNFVPTESHVARVREHTSSWAGAGVRARASWRATRSDPGEP